MTPYTARLYLSTSSPKAVESPFPPYEGGTEGGEGNGSRFYFTLADGGTLFLDEVGDMPLSLQPKLLRVLEDGSVTRVGDNAEKQVDVRMVAATNADLQAKLTAEQFRSDLYYRLAQYAITVPPLRERKEDIPALASHFLRLFSFDMNIAPPKLSDAALGMLQSYHFPGNIRELKIIIERAVIDSEGAEIQPKHLHITPPPSIDPNPSSVDLPMNLEQAELVLTRRALDLTDGNITAAARLLGISRPRMYRSLRKLEKQP